jgi:cyclase
VKKKPIRIITKLEIKNHNLVKGMNLEGLRALGRANLFSEHYYNSGVDEIIYQDIVASLYGQNTLDEFISETAKKIFIPLTVGGGIRSNSDIKRVLRCGADKVSINSRAFKSLEFIKKSVKEFGSSTISINIEAKLNEKNDYEAFYENGRTPSGFLVKNWIKIIQDLGVGEIVLTSIDHDGLGNGPDVQLLESIKGIVTVPFIYAGGISNSEQIVRLIKNYDFITGISLSSLLHYSAINTISPKSDNFGGNFDFLNNIRKHKKFKDYNISFIKKNLIKNKINCRN